MLVRGPRGDPAKSPGLVSYLHQKVLGLLLEPARVEGTVHADGVEQLLLVLPVEGRLANQHLVEEHAEGPPVHGVVVLLAQQNLQARVAETRLTGRGWRRGGTPPTPRGPRGAVQCVGGGGETVCGSNGDHTGNGVFGEAHDRPAPNLSGRLRGSTWTFSLA